MLDLSRLAAAYKQTRDELLAERTPDGHWVGELSSSALATATAVSALAVVQKAVEGPRSKVQGREGGEATTLDPGIGTLDLNDLIARGVTCLVTQQNADGGFGDTDLSHSNIATTYLAVAALHLAGVAEERQELLRRANAFVESKGALRGLRERYGIDKTFVVPIMTNLALAGLASWREIDPLPFELACVPQSLYRFVGMPVVSYAIPALVAIGQAQFHHAPPRNPLTRLIRWLSITRSLKVLRRMQPDSGGYLEATPLTSFVVMSLASVGVQGPRSKVQGQMAEVGGQRSEVGGQRLEDSGPAAEVIREGVKFLANSIRADGSWPIDTNLATWNTTLAINALAGAGEHVAELLGPQCLDWLLSCQHTKPHPFTGADPGGFGWSDLSGAVPDADDTPGALLALHAFHSTQENKSVGARMAGSGADRALGWLFRLKNRDGGWPTFCRGWGKLPFDRSGTDLTAHALRAFRGWEAFFADHNNDDFAVAPVLHKTVRRAGTSYLRANQHSDGSWSPLWFGNQDHPDEDNPLYGTAKVLMAYRDLGLVESPEAQRGIAWLVANQNEDGGWGSGVWARAQSAECGARSRGGPGRPSLEEPVLSTLYSVSSTEHDSANSAASSSSPSPPPLAPHIKSSVEETALAVEALLAACPTFDPRPPTPDSQSPAPSPAASAAARGLAWLLDRVERGEHRQPAPIGFYFAKLWYYERLYPLTFTVAALGRACRQFACLAEPDLHHEPAPVRSP